MSVYCTLAIGGLLLARDIDRLAAEIEAAGGSEMGQSIATTLRRGDGRIPFPSAEEGATDLDLTDLLDDLHLSYVWYQGETEDTDEQETFRCALTGDVASYDLFKSEIALKLDEIDNAETLAAARRWQRFKDELKLVVVPSNHALLEMSREGHQMRAYALKIAASEMAA